MRASYRYGVAWIAMNDDPTILDPEQLAGMLTVALLADLFAKEPDAVARDVITYRIRVAEAG